MLNRPPSSIISAEFTDRGEFNRTLQEHRAAGPRGVNTIQEILRILMKRWIWVAVIVVVAVTLSVVRSWLTKPVFGSTTTIELNKSDAGSAALDVMSQLSSPIAPDGDSLLTDLQTETVILSSDALAYDVIQKLHLDTQEPYASMLRQINEKHNGQAVNPVLDEARKRGAVLGVFKAHLNVQPVRGTRLIQVGYEDEDPARAAAIANAMIDSYRAQYLHSHYTATSEVSSWLENQLQDLKHNVEDSQKKLTDFEKETGILTFDMVASSASSNNTGSTGEAHSVVIQKLNDLNAELTHAEANRIEKEAIYRFAKSGNADTILAISNDPLAVNSNSAVLAQGGGLSALSTLRQQQGALKVSLANAATKYDINNRHLKDLQTQIKELDGQIAEETQRITARAEADFRLAKQSEDEVRRQFQGQQQEANKLNGKAVELAVLSQEAFSRKKLYEDLYTKLQEANVSAGIKATNITVVEPAAVQPRPVRPKPMMNAIMGMFFGVVLGLVVAFGVDTLDRTVKTAEEVEEITLRPVIATIPKFDARTHMLGAPVKGVDTPLLADSSDLKASSWMLSRPRSAIAESFRSLRTSLMLAKAGVPPKVILITSSVPGEGKTTVTGNLAMAFAQHNKRVLVIEADMRRPKLRTVLGADNAIGLSNILTGGATFEDAVLRGVAVPNLDVVFAGSTPPLPAEILDSEAFDNLLAEVRTRYDVVLLDSPPATVVTDAIPLAIKADGLIWLVRSGAATRPLVTRATEIVSKYRLPLLGYVMNGVDVNSMDYKYSYYGYSGSSGYYDEKNS